MKLLAIIFGAMLLPIALNAQTTYDGMTFPVSHPILGGYSNSSTLAAARTWYTANPTWAYSGTCTVGVGWEMSECTYVAFSHLMTANLGTPVDCTPAINWAVDIMNQVITAGNFNVEGDNGSNNMNNLARPLSLIYDWCYDQMTSSQRSTYIKGGDIAFGPFLGSNNGGTLPTTAYPVGYISGSGWENNLEVGNKWSALLWGMSTFNDDQVNAKANLDVFFSTYWTYIVPYFAQRTVGGGWGGVSNEGTNYGTFLYSHLVEPLLTTKALGRDLMSETTYWQQVPYALIYATLPAPTYTPQFSTTQYEVFCWSDSHCGLSTDDFLADANHYEYVNDLAIAAANEYQATNLNGYTRTWLNTLTPQLQPVPWIAALDKGGSPKPYSSLPLDYYASGTGFFWIRNAWDTTSSVVKLGLNTISEAAGHPGQDGTGNWEIWQAGQWMSHNTSGYAQNFTGWNNGSGVPIGDAYTAVGNGILVNPDNQGCAPYFPTQASGATCQGDGGLYWLEQVVSVSGGINGPLSPAKAIALQTQPTYAYAATDTTGAYYAGGYGAAIGYQSFSNNPAVNKVIREFLWFRDISTLVAFDRVDTLPLNGIAAGNIKRTFLAHCVVSWTLVDANHATCSPDGTQLLRLTTLLPTTPSPAYVDTNEKTYANVQDSQFRLEVNDTPGTAQSYFLNVMQSTTTSGTALAPSVSCSGSPTACVVTLDANHSATFVEGETLPSSGQSITINGATTPLTTSVESIDANTSGVFWGGSFSPSTLLLSATPGAQDARPAF